MENEFKVKAHTITIDPRKIRLLEINARFMTHEQFMRLVANVKRDGALTQTPFGWWMHDDASKEGMLDAEGEKIYEVLSGNHRTQAAIAAELELIDFQVTDQYLAPDQRKAIQISHNEITGQDDPAVLKIVYDSIESVEWRTYSGLDDNRLQLLEGVKADSLSAANLTFQTVSMVFLPDELEEAQATWDVAKNVVAGSKMVWVTRWEAYDRWLDGVEAASKTHGIKNVATAAQVILDIFDAHKDDLNEGWLEPSGEIVRGTRDIPVDVIMGTIFVPAKSAALLKRVIDRMLSKGEIQSKDRWQAVDRLAALYLEKRTHEPEQKTEPQTVPEKG